MPVDKGSRVAHLGALLEHKNRTIRQEAASAFSNFLLSDEKTASILLEHLASTSWEARVSTSDALATLLKALAAPASAESSHGIEPIESLKSLNLADLIESHKPLLSASSSQIDESRAKTVSIQQQRALIDQHLDFVPRTGVRSESFLYDADVVAQSPTNSPKAYEQGNNLTGIDAVKEDDEEACDLESSAIEKFTIKQISRLADDGWQIRHGAALAIARLLSSAWCRLRAEVRDACALRLLQVLALDRFNDFVSGRTAAAPVRESAAQGVAHYLNRTDDARRDLVLSHLRVLLSLEGEKRWVCRQSALLVMKYHFVIADHNQTFELFFRHVVEKLGDPVDDVVSTAVTALSSLFENETVKETQRVFVEKVLDAVWTLLTAEAKKEQIRSGMDTLAVDLLGIIDRWLNVNPLAKLSVAQVFVVVSLLDAAFVSRSFACNRIIATALDRGVDEFTAKEATSILKVFYRILLFAPPMDSFQMLEHLYLTSINIIEKWRQALIDDTEILESIGVWIGCIMLDHRNPSINVFTSKVEGASSRQTDPMERMCSDEMLFLNERERDEVYITRKILAAKFLAPLIQLLYESDKLYNEQPVPLGLQIIFVNFVNSSSMYHNLGIAIVAHEWSLEYKARVTRGTKLSPPFDVLTAIDSILRSGHKQFEELTNGVIQLTKECNEFINFCCCRGAVRDSLHIAESTVEDVAKNAFEQAMRAAKLAKTRETLELRYKVLNDWIEFTRVVVRSNTNRILAFFGATLLNFGAIGEKLTPIVRPLVESVQIEESETVAAELYKHAVPLLIVFSWTRNPKPYVKVIAKTIELFGSCNTRIPRTNSARPNTAMLSLLPDLNYSTVSRNAELMLHVCCAMAVEQVPEFFENFDLNGDMDDEVFILRLELHRSLWRKVGSVLSEKSTERILELLSSPLPESRHAAAKGIQTFCSSSLVDTLSRCFAQLSAMISNLESANARLGAAEALLCISRLESRLVGVVALLAPLVFSRLADSIPNVREAAAEAFRNFVPLLTLEKPSLLPMIAHKDIKGLKHDVELRHYQQEGITWMRFLRKFGLNGILADDMGLGKTLQTLAALAMSIAEESCVRPSLIVCPRTLIDHWLGEWRRWFPSLGKAIAGASSTASSVAKAFLVVTAYEDLKSSKVFAKQTWNYVILDEGHVLRNTKTAVWKAAQELTSQSRLILTGTPVQNTAADLWSLFAWLMPGYLGDEKQFKASFLKAMLRCRSAKATEKDLQNGADALNRLHRLVLPFVLRRMKQDVLPELPEKIVQDFECELSDAQRTLYKLIADRCTTDQSKLEMNIGLSPLHTLLSLRKVVDHPSLIAEILPRLEIDAATKALVATADSGKMAALGDLLRQCGIGVAAEQTTDDDDDEVAAAIPAQPHRALVFCQWVTSVQLVSRALTNGLITDQPVAHLVLDGRVPPAARQHIVDRFNSDHSIDVLVLTTHIGGIGLNLTGADVVIFLDHDWNPMKDLQAIDRAHRLGQQRQVMVYRLITKGTIEQKVLSYQHFKKHTAQTLISADNRALHSMATDELMSLFTLDGDGSETARKDSKPDHKRARIEKAAGVVDESRWVLSEMWDESQYEETSDVRAFARDAVK